jgi:hypothetical protein
VHESKISFGPDNINKQTNNIDIITSEAKAKDKIAKG